MWIFKMTDLRRYIRTDRDRQTDRQTDSQTNILTYRTDKLTYIQDRQAYRKNRYKHTDKQTDKLIQDRQTSRLQTDKYADSYTDKQRHADIDSQTGRQADRQTYGLTDKTNGKTN
jgi:hypothetical protein